MLSYLKTYWDYFWNPPPILDAGDLGLGTFWHWVLPLVLALVLIKTCRKMLMKKGKTWKTYLWVSLLFLSGYLFSVVFPIGCIIGFVLVWSIPTVGLVPFFIYIYGLILLQIFGLHGLALLYLVACACFFHFFVMEQETFKHLLYKW